MTNLHKGHANHHTLSSHGYIGYSNSTANYVTLFSRMYPKASLPIHPLGCISVFVKIL